ncbi:hypothetical protein PG994_008249 [Apiospora phragmitis]|uniref:Uncharacterized protein n=1 Tax=Apiospora phragmitis TaxID=2905665 RepID=A0ABR1USI6_9PEZI
MFLQGSKILVHNWRALKADVRQSLEREGRSRQNCYELEKKARHLLRYMHDLTHLCAGSNGQNVDSRRRQSRLSVYATLPGQETLPLPGEAGGPAAAILRMELIITLDADCTDDAGQTSGSSDQGVDSEAEAITECSVGNLGKFTEEEAANAVFSPSGPLISTCMPIGPHSIVREGGK